MTDSAALVRLQEIDLELMRHKRALDSLPQKERIRTIRLASKKLASQMTKMVGQRKDKEMELEDNSAAHGKMEGLVTEVQEKAQVGERDYRTIKDLESQLTALAKRIEKLDFERERLSGELDRLELAERNARGIQDRLKAEEDAQLRSYEKEISEIRREVERLVAERETVVGALSGDLLGRYEAAVARFSGLAVETLEGNRPSACRVTLQPSQFSDLRHGDEITECPYCHRILIVRGD